MVFTAILQFYTVERNKPAKADNGSDITLGNDE